MVAVTCAPRFLLLWEHAPQSDVAQIHSRSAFIYSNQSRDVSVIVHEENNSSTAHQPSAKHPSPSHKHKSYCLICGELIRLDLLFTRLFEVFMDCSKTRWGDGEDWSHLGIYLELEAQFDFLFFRCRVPPHQETFLFAESALRGLAAQHNVAATLQ